MAKVFVSSTSRDLQEHRAAVAKALLDAGFHPFDMANFGAHPDDATTVCLQEVAEADLFVGIYAWRYGYIPDGLEVSITEQEFIEARRLNKPCFCFLVDKTYAWPEEYREQGVGARLLRVFKAGIEETLVRATFTTPEDLAVKVLASLQRWERGKNRGLEPPFILPQHDVPTFTGRSDELARLEALLLEPGGVKVTSIVGLAGTGGIGKSALACHFAALHRDKFPEGVIGLRVDNKDPDTIARAFATSIGEEIDEDDERDATTLMQAVFAHRRVLLIFDNADNVHIRSVLPDSQRCAIIITTRDRGLPIQLDIPDDGVIDLPPLPDPDALLLLKKFVGEVRFTAEPEPACKIIGLVGNLPLALEIVGKSLKMRPGLKLADYAAALQEERTRLIKLQIRRDPHLNIRTSFNKSIDLLAEEGAEEIINFFTCLSVCAESGFSPQTAAAVTDTDASTAVEHLDYLEQLSLLNHTQADISRFIFHPLLRLFARELALERNLYTPAVERHAQYFINLIKTENITDPNLAPLIAADLDDIILAAEWLQHHDTPDYEFAIRLQPFFQRYGYWHWAEKLITNFLVLAERLQDWAEVIQFRIQLAKYCSLRGDWIAAEAALSPVAEIIDSVEPIRVQQYSRATWLNTLGGIYQRQRCFTEAIDALQRSYELFGVLGNSRGQAIVLTSLGSVYQQNGRLEEALDILQRSYNLSIILEGPLGQAMVLHSLGGVYQRLGRFEEALDVLQRSAMIDEKYGNQRGLAMVLNSLGGVYQGLSRFEEALTALQRSSDILEKLDDQHGLAMALSSLGGVLQRQGRFDKAVKVFQRSVVIEEEFGNRHGLAMVLNSLGGVLQRQGRFDEAVEAFQRSAEIGEALDDRRHLAMVLNSLGGVLQRQGWFDEAVEAFQRSYEISEKLEDQRSVAMVLNSLGGVLQRQGRFDEAVEAFQRSYEIEVELEDQRGVAMVLNSLGGVLQRQGRFDEAIEAFQRSYKISEKLEDQRSVAMVLNSLGGVLQRQGRFDEAVEAFRRSYEIEVELEDQRGQAMVLNSLGGVLQRQGRFDEAIDALQRSYEIQAELEDQRSVAMVLNSLGGVLQRQGRFDEAIEVLQRSYKIRVELGDQWSVAMVLNSLGGVLQRQGRFDEAVEALQRSYKIQIDLEDQRGQAMVLNSLGGVLQQQGQFDEAAEVFRQSIRIGQELKDRRHLAMAHTAFGRALLAQNKIEQAISELKQGFEIDFSLKNRRGLAIITPILGRTLKQAGYPAEALAYCRQALTLIPKNEKLLGLQVELSIPPEPVVCSVVIGAVKRIIQHAWGYHYGFIAPDDGSPDIYFREPQIDLTGLAAGVRVEAEVQQGRRGRVANRIRIIDAEPEA